MNDLIRELIKLRDKHGNLPIVHNDLELEVTGISYKYLIVKSNYLVEKKKEIVEDGRKEV